jgi:pyroglutamyl-peptidase
MVRLPCYSDPMLSPAVPPTVGQPRVLVTGFDPFGGQPLNPSWLAAQALDGAEIDGHRVVAAQLPTASATRWRSCKSCWASTGRRWSCARARPAAAPPSRWSAWPSTSRTRASPTTPAAKPIDTPVIAAGPAAYFTTLPIKAMLAALLAEGIRADVSQTAGTFVCNHVFYGLLHMLATDPRWAGTRGGLVHVPWLPQQGAPSMTLDQVVRGLDWPCGARCARTPTSACRPAP